jgi:N-methylhydantoinase A
VSSSRAALAVDIGGTFTDVALESGRGRFTRKVLTTPQEPEAGFIAGVQAVLRLANLAPKDVGLIVHGTTLLTNALLERKGARVAFITTEGHRDTLEIGAESRFHLYDLDIDKPRPLVPRELRFTVRERLSSAGDLLLPLHEQDVEAIAARLVEAKIDSVAIGFLHSYVNPAHERRAAEIIRARLPDAHLTLSSDISPEMREFDRFSTTCANAYVKPVAARYIARLEEKLTALGFTAPLFLMHSGGGMITPDTAREQPIRLLESGPAGGALFATSIAAEMKLEEAMAFDMGGTTAKVCLTGRHGPETARQFELDRVYRFLKGSGLPVRIPVIEMVEIGAGGGSIAHVDRMQRLQVGPESASSVPGPACYGRGGTRPTVTDADLVLERIDPESFGDGAVRPSRDKARAALESDVARPLKLEVRRAASGVCEIVDERMANAARAHVQESGRDLGAQTVIAFGGAGPLHAGEVATRLGIDTIVVPAGAGVGSAIGFLRAPIAFEIVRSLPARLSAFNAARVEQLLGEITEQAVAVVARAASRASITVRTSAFMRYVGQGYELEVPIKQMSASSLRETFEREYTARYGQPLGALEVEVLGWRVSASAPPMAYPPSSQADRQGLRAGQVMEGPAVIAESESTTFVPAGFSARVVEGGHIVMQRHKR